MRLVDRPLAVVLLLLFLPAFACQAATAQSRPAAPAAVADRPLVVISDLHMGIGRDAAGDWYPTEDFRWPAALAGFLDAIATEGSGGVDLLIAGDFLELWQPPAAIRCAGPPGAAPAAGSGSGAGNYGCSVGELTAIAEAVVGAHRPELAALSRFAATGGNCLVVIPGNHDAGLTLDAVWEPLAKALSAGGGCVQRVAGGVWSSPDGRVVVEHGHQIGHDANKYPDWPDLTRRFGDQEYVWQPWGEGFVQAIFNREEASFPLIDNLSPSSAGVRYRMAERGLGGSVKDVARFLRFNLFDTSLRQKAQFLGPEDEEQEEEPVDWDLDRARGLGHRLFAGALGDDDPFARALRDGEATEWAALRTELDALARSLPDEEVSSLCDQLAIRGGSESCARPTLTFVASRVLVSRKRAMRHHLGDRRRDLPLMTTFVYGHTHSFELPWPVRRDAISSWEVANSGAFQRLIDDDQLRRAAGRAGTTPGELLRGRSLDDLPACYTSVHISPAGDPEVRAWYMPEDAPAGRFVDPCRAPCPRVGHGCGV